MNQTKNISREESIDIIHDNILFTAFKRQLIDVSNLIGGTNQHKTEILNMTVFETLLFKMMTKDEMIQNLEKQICELLKKVFEKRINLYSYSQIINIDQLQLAEEIYNEWIKALTTFRNNHKAA
ncbi:hypothetical protein [Chryseobacterium turcicum]|uniref:Uncharacterized protein n=1 Tax=Chryseobacterium turcicum TaxID=2898076 RepID=A0A9Q3UYK8_9FLAO|nr:hypothetical protein [Chryseobacterium turcicum]MCD1115599.1 hypothetical protein [Chryseobacterium turcicum]